MMAKMFYTLDETKATLGKSEDEVKQYAREGRLREFRDGPRLMFKADQVDQLKSDLGEGGGRADIGVSDSGILGLADSAAPSGSGVISLADTDFGKSPGAAVMREETALAMDLGLTGSMSGIPSPGRTAAPGGIGGTGMGMTGTGMGMSGTGVGMSPGPSGSRGGITVFDVDDAHKADPMAQTAIGSGIQDQIQLESVGSGSGLLDLTRESDDTSLGAELLDEMGPGASVAPASGRRAAVVSDSAMGMVAEQAPRRGGAVDRSRSTGPVFIEAHDALAGGFGGLALFGAIIILFGAFVLINAVSGQIPELVGQFSPKSGKSQGMMYLGGAGIVGLIFFIVGWMIGKAGARR